VYLERKKGDIMMYQFTEDCRIGIQEIDEEHEKLFQLINQTMEMAKIGGDSYTTAKNLVTQLKEYALTHFAHEESYMEQIHDKELERQKKEHQLFKEKVNSYQIEELSVDDGEKVMEELLTFAAKWLYHHIIGSDTMIGMFTEQAGEQIGEQPPEDAFAFTDAYKTGIELVDEEHKKLFEIIRETNDVIHAELLHDKYDAIVQIIGELKEYTVKHFTDEEKYMESIHYEGIHQQRIAHNAFVERLEEINFDDMDENQEEYLDELIHFLLEWLTNHILKMDKKIPVSSTPH
jgi:hemerythrin